MTGWQQIKAQYVTWARQAHQQERQNKVEQYLAGLRRVNPDSTTLVELETAWRSPTPVPVLPTPTPLPTTSPIIRLRSEPMIVTPDDAHHIFGLTTRQFYWGKTDWAPQTCIENQYEDQDEVVYDHATRLTWQKSGSPNIMTYQKAQEYIKQLNPMIIGIFESFSYLSF